MNRQQTSVNSNNKRIAQNTLFMYLRKFIVIIINLYTSRLLLQTLGIDDFGLYGLIGSIVVLFSSLRSLFASSIQRFINIEIGRQNTELVNKMFSIGVQIHLILSVIFFIVVEIAGLIIIPDLNIPGVDKSIAFSIFHFSVLTAIASIMTVPYDALIIANEKFKAFAVLSLIEYLLKFGVIFLLVYSPISRVVFYSVLIFTVTVIVRIMNVQYCKRTFGEDACYRQVRDYALMKEMLRFAGWQFIGSSCYSLAHAGVNFVVNIFGGVAINAARTIAYQVQGLIEQFSSDLNVSFRPQIVNNYATGEMGKCYKLMFFSTKATFMVSLILVFVIECMTFPILQLWLDVVPPNTVVFVQVYLLFSLIHCFYYSIDVIFKASGNIKRCSISDAIVTVLNLPLSWIALKVSLPYYSVFVIMCILELIGFIIKLVILNKLLHFNTALFYNTVLTRAILCIVVMLSLFLFHHYFIYTQYSTFSVIIFSVAYGLIASFISFIIMFTRQERSKLISMVLK